MSFYLILDLKVLKIEFPFLPEIWHIWVASSLTYANSEVILLMPNRYKTFPFSRHTQQATPLFG